MSDIKELIPDFDAVFLGHSDEIGGGHLEDATDVTLARENENGLLLSPEAEKFVTLITLHGLLPSEAYTQAFAQEDEYGKLIVPDMPAYQARVLLRLPEIKEAIEQQRAEIRSWTKTSVEEVEMTHRRIMMDPNAKHSDRIAAGKALSALRGFDAQPDMLQGATIIMQMPFTPKALGHQAVTIEHQPLDKAVNE